MAAVEEGPPLRREMVRVPLRRAAALMLVGARELRGLIADTETSRAIIASVIHLLDEASRTSVDLFGGPTSGPPIDAARRSVGRLYGVLQPAAYQQIDQCRVHLAHLDTVFARANAHATRCAEILRFTDESPQLLRWRRLMDLGVRRSTEAGKWLFKADAAAAGAYSTLLDLVRYWNRLRSLDRAKYLVEADGQSAGGDAPDARRRHETGYRFDYDPRPERSLGILGHHRST